MRKGFAVPAEGKFGRIVNTLFLLFLFGWTVPGTIGRRRRRLYLVQQFLLALARGQREPSLDVGLRLVERWCERGEGGGEVREPRGGLEAEFAEDWVVVGAGAVCVVCICAGPVLAAPEKRREMAALQRRINLGEIVLLEGG